MKNNEQTKRDKMQKPDDGKILAKIKEHYDLCVKEYAAVHKKMQLLDATDRGDMWKALKAKYPKYQIFPDTNYVTYVKNNQLSSIYTVTKGASIQPTSEKDKDLIVNLNVAMEHIWDIAKVGFYQFQAGERAALLNLGITQVGWDDNVIGGNVATDNFYKGNVTLKNIDPIKFMIDPYATSFETASYCMTYDRYPKHAILENPLYKTKAKEYFDKQLTAAPTQIPEMDAGARGATANGKYATLLTYWCKKDGKVNEYHTLNGEFLLYAKEDIKPSCFPFALLYSNLPTGDLVGSSECSKIFANAIAYNLLDSIAITAEYKNQRPPKFVSTQSGLNIQSFIKHGDEAEKTFVVNGRADQAVHYHQFPQTSPQLTALKMGLQAGIELTSGIDGRYTGRDTGSVITTGGVEDMLNRVTLIDTPKIILYEDYTKQLTKLILANMLEFSPKRKYFIQKPQSTKWETIEVDFPKIDSDTLFSYSISVSSELPKNKQRIAATADMLMEKQMQYQQQGSSIQLITEEEWLELQDLPNKERMLERMGVQRQQDAVEEVSQVLFQYADLIEGGMPPEDALLSTAQSLQDKRAGNMEQLGGEGLIPGAVPVEGGGLEAL
jgi:hypothetical protein